MVNINFSHKNLSVKNILVCGAQGTGKTTLVREISSRKNIRELTISTQSVMNSFGFKNHQDVLRACIMSPDDGIAFQRKLIEDRYSMFYDNFKSGTENTISDRGCIDSYVYYLLQCASQDTNEGTEYLADITMRSLELFTDIIYLPCGRFNVENNYVRKTNKYYQATVGSLIYEILFKRETHLYPNKDFPLGVKTRIHEIPVKEDTCLANRVEYFINKIGLTDDVE